MISTKNHIELLIMVLDKTKNSHLRNSNQASLAHSNNLSCSCSSSLHNLITSGERKRDTCFVL